MCLVIFNFLFFFEKTGVLISVSQYRPQKYWLSCWIWNMLSSITVKMYFGKIFNAVASSENTLLCSSLQKTYAMTISLCNVTGGVGTLDDNTCRQVLAPPSKTTLLSVSFQKQGRKRFNSFNVDLLPQKYWDDFKRSIDAWQPLYWNHRQQNCCVGLKIYLPIKSSAKR